MRAWACQVPTERCKGPGSGKGVSCVPERIRRGAGLHLVMSGKHPYARPRMRAWIRGYVVAQGG